MLSSSSTDLPARPAFRLKSLEEHRFATRFEPKKVTPQTWPAALRGALRRLRAGDRIQQVEALYVLLEVADLRPRGCDLARVWLNAGAVYLAFSHLDEAVRALRQCLHIDPRSWRARFNLGLALARQRVFAIATSELEQALACACPPEIAERIHELLRAIDTIQSRRNEQAYRATDEARAFTWRYLETLHLLTTSREKRQGTTRSSMADIPPPPSAPLLFDVARGWKGPIAGLLHDLHVHASMHSVSLENEYSRLDPGKTGTLAFASFEMLFRKLCGSDMPRSAVTALCSIFPDNTIMTRLLVPNPETLAVIDEMHRVGYFYAGMSWSLTKRRLERSLASRTGGLWRCMELSVDVWTREVSTRLHLSAKAGASLPGLLLKRGLITPMHFVGNRGLSRDAFVGLLPGDQELVLAELDRVASAIRDESCRTLQMFFRRLRRAKLPKQDAVGRSKLVHSSTCGPSVPAAIIPCPTTICEQQEITRSVLGVLDELVESVVLSIRSEVYARMTPPAGDTPVRTENRHRLD